MKTLLNPSSNTTPTPALAPATAATTTTVANDLSRQIEGVEKKDINIIPKWNGDSVSYSETMRSSEQVGKAHGMGALFFVSTTPPANDGSQKWELWDKQNEFLSAALMIRWNGGQAAIIIRKHCNDQHNKAWTIIKEIKKHYESHQNKSAAITKLVTDLTALKYTTRSNYSITKHLEKFQGYLQDLADNGHQIGD